MNRCQKRTHSKLKLVLLGLVSRGGGLGAVRLTTTTTLVTALSPLVLLLAGRVLATCRVIAGVFPLARPPTAASLLC